jgi:hypothetical protein
MELGWGALVLLLATAAVIWFLQDSLAARERANTAAMEACQRLSLQFLDGTVAFARLTFVRERGQLAVRRTYVFDYTANSIERRQGFVILVGRRVESMGYAPGEEQRARAQSSPSVTISLSATYGPAAATPASPPALPNEPESTAASQPNQSAVVFDLAQWRTRRRATEQQPTPRRTGNSATDNSGCGNGQVDGQDSHP